MRRTTIAASAATLAAKRAARAKAAAEAQAQAAAAGDGATEPAPRADAAEAVAERPAREPEPRQQPQRPAAEERSPWARPQEPAANPRPESARLESAPRESAQPQRGTDLRAEQPAPRDRSLGDSVQAPVALPTRQRPTTPTLGALPAHSPVIPADAPSGPVQPPSAETRFAAGAQAIAGAQAARSRSAEPDPAQADGREAADEAPAQSARPAPGKSNIKDRSRSAGQPTSALEPRLSGQVPTAAEALAATQPTQDPVPSESQPASQRPAPGRSNQTGQVPTAAEALAATQPAQDPAPAEAPAEPRLSDPASTEPQVASERPAPGRSNQTGPVPTAAQALAATQAPAAAEDAPAQDAVPAEPAPAPAAAETTTPADPPKPRPEPGVRAAGIYTAPQREQDEQDTQAFAVGDATLPGVPVPPAVPAADAADEWPGAANSAGRAARRQQQRSFGQAATAAALLDPPGGTRGGGGDDHGGGDDGDSGDDAPGGRSKARVAALVVAGVVVVLGIGYGVAYAVAGDSLARGATVAGIDVGGMTPEQAEDALNEQLPALVDQPFNLTIGEGETSFELVPSAAGLTVDVPATVDQIPGGSANPASLVRALLGGGETTPVAAVDRTALEAALAEIGAQADIEAVNGAVAFDGGEVVTSDPQPGRAVNPDATIERLQDVFFGAEARLPLGDVPLVIDEVQPAVSAEEVQRAVAEFAEPAMSAPVTVVAGEESVELPPDLVGQALTMAPDDAGTLQPALDGAKLTEVARDLLTEVGQEGRDATITIEGGEPVVVPAERGQGIAPETLSAALLPVLTAEGDAREAAVELTEVDPELTTAAAEELGVTEVVAEFTTRFPHAEYRNINIGTAAERIDNTLLLPGDEFSLNGIVGERTEANGFTAGTIINGGRLEESLGGGVSQVATTTFHAAFLAGLQDVEHWPHSIYFDRYPVGQEATVAWGSKDMRFANDTPYGVVVDTSFTRSTPGNSGTLNVKIWSTEYYSVETSVSERSNFTSPRTIYDTSDNCSPQGGSEGFDITSFRQVTDPEGKVVKDESFPWTYNPNHRVICGPDPGDAGGTGGGDEGGDDGE